MTGRMAVMVVAGSLVAGAALAAESTTTTVPGAPTAPTPVARGEYLTKIMGCAGCHTPWGAAGQDASKLYAGSPPRMPGKGGGTPNITPDPATGIGLWTDAQIAAAIREGKRPDGTLLSPHMPSAAYHAMTDADVAAMVAFLRTVPPVVNKIERGKPERKLKALPPAVGNVDPADDPVKHGAYLASLLRCAGCHTPEKGQAKGRAYAGGNEFPQGPGKPALLSSNITSDHATGIGGWTAEDVANAVRQGVRPDGTSLGGPMGWLQKNWAALTDADASALAAYVKAIPPVVNKVRGPAPANAKAGT